MLTKMPFFDNIILDNVARGYGGIGRRVRFRFLWPQGRAGSSPVIRTIKAVLKYQDYRFRRISRIVRNRDVRRIAHYTVASLLASPVIRTIKKSRLFYMIQTIQNIMNKGYL